MRPASSVLRQARLAQPSARRLFSSSSARLERYGFIGLGQMGYQMAKNLQSKLTSADTVRLFDINKAAVQQLVSEVSATGAAVEVVPSVVDAAKDAVSQRAPSIPIVFPSPTISARLLRRLAASYNEYVCMIQVGAGVRSDPLMINLSLKANPLRTFHIHVLFLSLISLRCVHH